MLLSLLLKMQQKEPSDKNFYCICRERSNASENIPHVRRGFAKGVVHDAPYWKSLLMRHR